MRLCVKGELAGGAIIREMAEAGELQKLFDEKGGAYDKSKKIA